MKDILTEEQLETWLALTKGNRGVTTATWTVPVESQPTDLELRIRKEVMDAVKELIEFHEEDTSGTSDWQQEKTKLIKDRLNLLWGE